LDEEGQETALGSSSDPERSSVSGGLRDCDSELEDEERGGGGSGGAHPEESGSSPMPHSASSLFIKRTVDEVTIQLTHFYNCKLLLLLLVTLVVTCCVIQTAKVNQQTRTT
jgi:hypothetical protein